MYIHGNHWLVAFTLECSNGKIEVFDSLYASVGKKQQNYFTLAMIKFEMVDM